VLALLSALAQEFPDLDLSHSTYLAPRPNDNPILSALEALLILQAKAGVCGGTVLPCQSAGSTCPRYVCTSQGFLDNRSARSIVALKCGMAMYLPAFCSCQNPDSPVVPYSSHASPPLFLAGSVIYQRTRCKERGPIKCNHPAARDKKVLESITAAKGLTYRCG
jgi:hypothetical protein